MGYIFNPSNYLSAATDASTVAGHLEKQIQAPANKIVQWQTVYVTLTLANTARTANPRVWIQVLDAQDHPASSSDILVRFPAPITQALNTTRNYIFSNLPFFPLDSDAGLQVAATDHIYCPMPNLILSTAQILEVYIENDTGIAADDIVVYGIYGVADKAGGPS